MNKVNKVLGNTPYLDRHSPIFSKDAGALYEAFGGLCTKSAASLVYGVTEWNSMLKLVPSLIEKIEWFAQYVAFLGTIQLDSKASIEQAK